MKSLQNTLEEQTDNRFSSDDFEHEDDYYLKEYDTDEYDITFFDEYLCNW